MKARPFIAFAFLGFCVIGLLALNQFMAPGSDKATTLQTLHVRFPIPALRASMAPFVAAGRAALYASENLEVSFQYGGSGTNPVSMVVQGKDDIGVLGGPDTLLVAKGNGADLVTVAVLHKDADFVCLVSLASSRIARIEELDGKRVGMYPGHISTDILRSLFRKAGIKPVEVDVGYDYGQLINGKIDAQWAFTTAAAVELPEKGIAVNVISPKDHGVRSHGYTIFVRRDYLKKNRDTVLRFLKATFKGVQYTHDHPAKVASMLVQEDKSGNLEQKQVERRLAELDPVTSVFKPYPPGYMDEAMFRTTYDRLNEQGLIKQPYDVREAFDTSLLSEIHGSAMQVSTSVPGAP